MESVHSVDFMSSVDSLSITMMGSILLGLGIAKIFLGELVWCLYAFGDLALAFWDGTYERARYEGSHRLSAPTLQPPTQSVFGTLPHDPNSPLPS